MAKQINPLISEREEHKYQQRWPTQRRREADLQHITLKTKNKPIF